MLTKWRNRMKNSWKYATVGFVVGLIMMFCIGNFINKKQIDEEIPEIHQQDEAGQPGTERPTPTSTAEPITIEGKETEGQQVETGQESAYKSDGGEEMEEEGEEISKGIRMSNNMELSEDFVAELLLYQYIEYGIRKYNEDHHLEEKYYVDIESDMLPYDTKFCMKNAREEAYRIDLAKEIIPELSNNIFNFMLENENKMLYMSIDTFNMKIFIYDAVEE